MKGGYRVKLSKRQEQIAQIVREEGPVTGSAIAEHLEVTSLRCAQIYLY